MKPFIKWAGGKTQMLPHLLPIVSKMPKYNRVIEVFLGGGSFTLKLEPERAIINDLNPKLINCFQCIKDDYKKLIREIDKLVCRHSKDFYYSIRQINPKNKFKSAALFIYLNKTCFNGLYRENSKGIFNVPYNGKDNLCASNVYSESNLRQISEWLNQKHVSIINESFEAVIRNSRKGDLLFLDPPYDSDTKTFTQYTKNNWTKNDTIKLAKLVHKASKRGVKFILTNHNSTLINDLFSRYEKELVNVNRMINANALNRQKSAYETIFTNF